MVVGLMCGDKGLGSKSFVLGGSQGKSKQGCNCPR